MSDYIFKHKNRIKNKLIGNRVENDIGYTSMKINNIGVP